MLIGIGHRGPRPTRLQAHFRELDLCPAGFEWRRFACLDPALGDAQPPFGQYLGLFDQAQALLGAHRTMKGADDIGPQDIALALQGHLRHLLASTRQCHASPTLAAKFQRLADADAGDP
ncbi:hypothetical protein D3C80_1599610 [compost metagenome]